MVVLSAASAFLASSSPTASRWVDFLLLAGAGAIVALAASRAGDASLIAGYLDQGKAFEHAIADYASAFTDLMMSDYAEFEAWRRP